MIKANRTVDIIIPVYQGFDETLRCLDSVLNSRKANQSTLNVIVIFDAGPDRSLFTAIQAKQQTEQQNGTGFMLLDNPSNLGFVATVNRGMKQTNNDVILLNSDTEVANDWVDRLVFHAEKENIASVTPFSNNATICSYPNYPEGGELINEETVTSLDHLFAKTNPQLSIEIPTAIGFCMYIPRTALDAVGLFDVEAFGKGYGEENDFCWRAKQLGLLNLFALDTFVYHAGGVSFSEQQTSLQKNALAVLTERYPDYEAVILAHIKDNPAQLYRGVVDLFRLSQQSAEQNTEQQETYLYLGQSNKASQLQSPQTLQGNQQANTVFIEANTEDPRKITVKQLQQGKLTHFTTAADYPTFITALAGFNFTNQFVSTENPFLSNLSDNITGNKRGVLHIVSFFGGGTLRYLEDLTHCVESNIHHYILFTSEHSQVLFDTLSGHYITLNLYQDNQWQLNALLNYLSKRFNELVIHLHALFSASLAIAAQLSEKIPTLATLHDHYFLSNLSFEDNKIVEDPAWIEEIKEQTKYFKHFIVPSHYLLDKAKPHFGERASVINHGITQPDSEIDVLTQSLCDDLIKASNWDKQKKTIAIIGAIGEHKGLSALGKIRRKMRNYQFLLLGYTSYSLTPQTGRNFIQHGLYHHKTIPALLNYYGADLVLFLPGIAESYCYALSDVYATLPVLAPDHGALGQRIQSEQLGEIYPTDITAKQLKQIIDKLFASPPTDIVPNFKTVEQMNKETEQFYLDFYDKDWKNIPVSDDTLQDFMRESLSEENFKMAMVHLSRENYFLKRDNKMLHNIKRITLRQSVKETIAHVIWRIRHTLSVVRRTGLKKSVKLLISRFRSKL